ncbi:RagB/SusD family nutrient uptake outer membrane protein [Sphingobacterium corticis]|uniref:RagB/SusD family nutrient uptake outer membrane protein n=1 Tax=Sphingobacterium corticis TaxID=1812823 RepID=A0ABW5NFX3_9SPHI
MKRQHKFLIFTSILAFSLASCEKYLDVMPDNRAVLDSEDKISKILVSAYPQSSFIATTEFSSDNVDDYSVTNPNYERILEQMFRWEDITEVGNDGPNRVWESCYAAIGNANQALASIEELGNPTSLDPQRGEAYVARAYSHFVLVNVFAHHYTKANAATDLGVTYMEAPERELDPKYQRNSVAEVYALIKADLEKGIPLIDDGVYGGTPKYHMNRAAANAFAARVALYTQDWDGAVRYATAAVGTNPAGSMRDNARIALSAASLVNASIAFTSSGSRSNLFILTAASTLGTYFGPYYDASRFAHGRIINENETFFANTPWGKLAASAAYTPRLYIYTGTNLDKTLIARLPYLFEYTDPVARIGYRRTVYAPFNVEETMLVRAEANIHLKNYDAAFTDMQLWVRNNVATVPADFSIARINTWANNTAYYTPTAPTAKKRLNPEFTVEAGTQENMLQALLLMRRLETMHVGLRWFDIKRYGIEVTRRVIVAGSGNTMTVGSTEAESKLGPRDKRHALQLPTDVISAGLTPNRQ